MDDLLTAKQVQELLKVDRITVYRMLQDGRLKGVKIGQQWRFRRGDVERLLEGKAPAAEALPPSVDSVFPVHCVQTIQDLFSDVSQISSLVIDQEGQPVTQISRPCPFVSAILAKPAGQEAFLASWREFIQHSRSGSKYFTGHTGLQYIGAPILDKDEQIGLFLTGPFYWQAPDPKEETDRIRRLSATYEIPVEELRQAAKTIPVIDPAQRAQVEAWPSSAARAIQSILHERIGFVERLQKIANLTQL